MSIAYKPRNDATELAVVQGETFGAVLDKKGLRAKWKLVGQYNWGTKEPAEINRALIELVGCEKFEDDPLNTVLDPDRGTGGKIYEPETWTPTLDAGKVHTVTVKKRLAAPGVCIKGLTALFEPGTDDCHIDYLLEGDAERVKTADLEVHVASYWGLTGRSSASVAKPDVEEYVTSYYEEVMGKDSKGNRTEAIEKPCGTDSKENVKETHLFRKSEDLPRGTTGFVWDGKSKAKEGVLKADAFIHSRCAPYLVSVRYYKDAIDKTVILRLKPFYPQWKLTGKKKWDLIEESLIVEWKVEGEESSKAKLKNGQIRLYDEAGLVFFAPLTADQIKSGKYNLLTEPIKWDKSKVDMKKLPYRIEIQVHSDDEEDNGLALAVMPTQVPAYNYEQVQFVGYDACNDTNAAKTEYLGDSDDDTDIDFRVAAMIEAIQKAKPGADADRKILKVFVAPEFYYRGEKGAYAFEKISTIMPKLRKETDKFDYLDWWFVFGTALGSHSHETNGIATEHGNAIHLLKIESIQSATDITAKVWSAPKQGWELHTKNGQPKTITGPPVWPVTPEKLKFPSRVRLTLSDTAGLVTNTDKLEAWVIEPVMTILDTDPSNSSPTDKIVVASAICSQIAVDPDTNKVITVGGTHWEAESEGTAKRITHAAFDGVLKQFTLTLDSPAPFHAGKPLVLREPQTVEVINAALMQKGWNAPHLGDGSLREVITYKEDMSHIDYIRNSGITSSQYYDPTGAGRKIRMNYANDVPFLPTTGAKDIGGASPNVVRQPGGNAGSEINETGLGGGCVIMVDRVTFGVEVCRDHCVYRLFKFFTGPNVRAGDPLVQVQLIPSWGMSIGLVTDHGKEVAGLRNALVFNVDGPRMNAVARVWDTTYSCDTHVTVSSVGPGDCTEPTTIQEPGILWYKCDKHGGAPEWFKNAACPTHGALACGNPLQPMGTALTAIAPIDVPKSKDTKYFRSMGNVRVFPAKPLPDPDVATVPPTLNSITNGTQDQGLSVEVTLKGSNLSDARWVNVDGEGVSASFPRVVSDTEVKATLYVAANAVVGTRNITVSNLSGISAGSVVFTVALRPPPTILSLTPIDGFVYNLHAVTLRGTNLLTCSNVGFSSAGVFHNADPVFADDHIDLQIWLNDTAVLGPCTVTVTTAGGSATGVFTVKDRPLPIVNFVVPDVYDHGYIYPVVVTGTDLDLAVDATMGAGVVLTNVVMVSNAELRMDVYVRPDAVVGPRDLILTPRSGTVPPYQVTINTPAAPVLIDIVPDEMDQGFPVSVLLTGTDLLTTNLVTASGAGVTVVGITNVTPTDVEFDLEIDEGAAPGGYDIAVTTLGGVSNAVVFRVNLQPPPTLYSVSPNFGAEGKTVQVTIDGADLWHHKDLQISGIGVTVASIDKDENDQLVATLQIASGASHGNRDLTVTNHGGVSNVLPFTVTPIPVPKLDSVSPAFGSCTYAVDLILAGRNLNGYTAIYISGNGITQKAATVATDNRIEVRIVLAIDADQTQRDITVTTPDGTSNAVTFKVNPRRAPTIGGIGVANARRGDAGGCYISGTDLVEAGTITCSSDKVVISGVSGPAPRRDRLTFYITIGADTPLGSHRVTYTNRFGSATVDFNVVA